MPLNTSITTGWNTGGRARPHTCMISGRCWRVSAHGAGPGRMQVGGPVRRLVIGDHALAAPGIARERQKRQRRVRRKQPCVHQRLHQSDAAAGVAARHGDAPRASYGLRLRRAQFRKAVGKTRVRAVGGGGVQTSRLPTRPGRPPARGWRRRAGRGWWRRPGGPWRRGRRGLRFSSGRERSVMSPARRGAL